MCKNKRFIGVIAIAICVGFLDVDASGATQFPLEFEGRFELFESLDVGLNAGTAEHPNLVRIEWIRFDTRYANAWRVTARVDWLPVKDATWRLTIELLDKDGRVLRHPTDEPTIFTGKAGQAGQTEIRCADLDLDAMQDQGRRHAARFRMRLEPSQERVANTDSTHTLEVAVLDRESREPISDVVIVVETFDRGDTIRREKALYCTDSQGRCSVSLARDRLTKVGISAQKQGYCTIEKSWPNYGYGGIGRVPLAILPRRHEFEMVHATALGGIVQDTERRTIEGTEVDLSAYLEEPSGVINVNRTVRTDAKGRWRIDGVSDETERVTLRVRHPDYGGNNGRNQRISGEALVKARALKHVEILEKGLTITGRVLDERERPVIGAAVMLEQFAYNRLGALTDASGAFRLVCSSDPSVYREAPSLIVEAPGYALVQRTIELDPNSKPLEFRLKPGRNVTCRVMDTQGQPIVGAWTVVDPLPGNRDYSVWLKDTDERGEFQIPNVPKNDVKLTIGKQGYIAIRDRVISESENEIVATMQRALRVHGKVTDAKTGKPIPNFEIASVYVTGGRTRTSSLVAFAEGTYEVSFDEMRPETRQLQVTAVGYEPATSDQIKTDEGEHVVDFKLVRSKSFNQATAGLPREQIRPTGPRRITGMVCDEQGKPVPDAIVRTCPQRSAETVTNAKGIFTLKLMRRPGSMGTIPREEMMYLLARHKERNLAVAIELDPTADKIDITLTPGAILAGKVVDVEGKGIPRAELSLTFWTSSIGYGIRETAEIDEAGHYQIRAVPCGHKYSVNASAEGYGRRYVQVDTGGASNERLDVEPLVLSLANLWASGIVVDDFDQPVSGIRIYAYGNGQPSRETFTDTKGRFTIENICPGPLNIQANSQGRAARRFRGRARVEGGATNIRIVVDELDERGRSVPRQPSSLIGKRLPELKDLGIKFSPDDIESKRILVCFWDMQQRPSRHCMTQLAKQVESLKRNGVMVVAIQASNVDTDALDGSLKKYNVPFLGMVEGDARKIRFSWGVQSLPWLILTDTNHLVQAEGFAMHELDAKLQKISGD